MRSVDPERTVVPTGKALAAMASVIDQCQAVGVVYRLVGLDHPWEALAVALDHYLEMPASALHIRDVSDRLDVLLPGYALAWGSLLGLDKTVVREFDMPPVLTADVEHRVAVTMGPYDVCIAPEVLLAHWSHHTWIPDVSIARVTRMDAAGTWLLSGPYRLRFGEMDAYGRCSIPLLPTAPPYDLGQSIVGHALVTYTIDLVAGEQVLGLRLAILGAVASFPVIR